MTILDVSRPSTRDRFWAKVTKSSDCWECGGSVNGAGYASHGDMGAHRYSYILHFGPIPGALWVLHHCDNRRCVRPDHLFLGTASDNALDCSAKGRANGPARAHHGEDHGRAKLTWAIVDEIRRRHPAPTGRGRSLPPYLIDTAAEFGVSSSLISMVVKGTIWQRPSDEIGGVPNV